MKSSDIAQGIIDNMKTHITVTRAISSEFALRKVRQLAIMTAIILFTAVCISLWLTTVHVWWWLLAAPVIILSVLATGAIFVAIIVIRVLRPRMVGTQKAETAKFVDKLERVADHLQTPMFLIVFRVVRDILRPRGQTFVQLATEDSTSLHTDLRTLQKLFKEN